MASSPQAGTIAMPPAGRPLTGVLLLLASTWALSALDSTSKWSMAAGVSLLFLCWVRYAVHLVLVLCLVLPSKGLGVLRSLRLRYQILRGVVMLTATLVFFLTLQRLPQAQATSIGFLAPLLMLVAAPWVLNEPARLSRWLAAGVGFIGVLIVVRPSGGLDPLGVVFGLVTACLYATQFIITRRVAVDNALTTLVWSGLVGTIGMTLVLPFILPTALPILRELSITQWLVVLSTGVFGGLGHLFQIQAYRNAPASMLAPFQYAQILSASTLGWLVWRQFPDAMTWVGIGIICTSGIGIGLWEWRMLRRGRPAATTA